MILSSNGDYINQMLMAPKKINKFKNLQIFEAAGVFGDRTLKFEKQVAEVSKKIAYLANFCWIHCSRFLSNSRKRFKNKRSSSSSSTFSESENSTVSC